MSRRDRFLTQASELLALARAEAAAGRYDQALEMAYRSALRTAGARVADSPVARRRRLPTSAWAQLALVGAEDKAWAAKFEKFSRVRSRVGNGLDATVADSVVFALLEQAAAFLDATRDGVGGGLVAA